MANFISYLLCFCCTVQTVYSLCVIGTDCSVHVILSTGDLVTIKPQIDIQQSVGCVVNASATAVDRNSRSTFPVTANTSAVTVCCLQILNNSLKYSKTSDSGGHY